jgi:hypothetical protein
MDEAAVERVRQAIIEWLGGAYDPHGQYPGNPDYRNTADVDALVISIIAAVRGDGK